MSELQRRLYEGERGSGWDPRMVNTFAEECAHLHEEVSEAFRAWRENKHFATTYRTGGRKPLGVPVELADVVIGCFYLAELHGFDLMDAIELKHAYNLTRDYVAEGRQLHPEGLPRRQAHWWDEAWCPGCGVGTPATWCTRHG